MATSAREAIRCRPSARRRAEEMASAAACRHCINVAAALMQEGPSEGLWWRRRSQKASGVPGDAERKFDLWLQTATRYFVLTDAGAAVAVPSFIGNSNTVPKLAVASLLCLSWVSQSRAW